jgi:hypothetical protein
MGSNLDKANRLTNGALLIISTVLKHIISFVVEAEIWLVFINAREGTFLDTTLEEMGHPRPPTPLDTDNTTSTGYRLQLWKHKTKMYMSYGYAILLG